VTIIIDVQIDDFKKWAKYFGCPLTISSINLKTSIDWWKSCGDEYSKLQKIVIHILSLTCSSSIIGISMRW